MYHLIREDSADDAWLKAIELFQKKSIVRHQSSRNGETLEISNVCIEIKNPRKRWVISRSPAINPAFAIAEVIWNIRGRNDLDFLKFFNGEMEQYSDDGRTLHGAYGQRLRSTFDFDQLDRSYKILKNNPDSRQVVLQYWDSRKDFPCVNGAPSSKDIPCNIVSLIKVREGRLEWTQIMRSNDMFIGFPYDVVQFTSLQEFLACKLGVEIGTYHHYADSLHFYDRDKDCLDSRKVDLENIKLADQISQISSSESDLIALEKIVIELLSLKPDLIESIKILETCILNDYAKNMLCIVLCAALRKNHRYECFDKILERCTNTMLITLWKRWIATRSSPSASNKPQ